MSLPRYEEYKDSGVAWLGSVPARWNVSRLKEVIRSIESGVSVNATDAPAAEGAIGVLKTSCVYDGTFRFAENKAVVEEDLARVSCPVTEGTLIVSRMNTPALVGAAGLVTQSHPNIYLPDRLWQVSLKNSSPGFVHYWTLSGEYRAQVEVACSGTSSSMQNLGQDQFKNFQIALPAEEEQQIIATFLDRETAKIDALIAEQEKLLALLAEKRQATISHAVTRGLNPNAPMKDSGIPWLGEVPAHWDVVRLKHVTPQITVGIVVEPSKYYVNEGVPALRSLNVKEGTVSSENLVFISTESNDLLAKSKIFTGDIVVVRSGQTGAAAVVPDAFDGANCIDLIVIRKPHEGCEKFLCRYLASHVAARQFEAGSEGAIQKHFNIGTAANLVVAWPDPKEQRDIASFLDAELAKLAELDALSNHDIQLLRERRGALISAAVTGKIDVRAISTIAEVA